MDIKYLKGVGDKRAKAFNETGITALEDFLGFVPRAYLKKIPVKDIRNHFGENVLVSGKVIEIDYPSRPVQPTKVYLNDMTGTVEIPVFGASEFRSKQFRINNDYAFWGKVTEGFRGKKYQLDYRDHLRLNTEDTGESEFINSSYLPVYELPGVLKKTWIKPLLLSKIVFNAFTILFREKHFLTEESLPEKLVTAGMLMPRGEAVKKINFPKTMEEAERARKRLSFDELFYLQLLLALKRRSIRQEVKGISFKSDIKKLTSDFLSSIKFRLTGAQKRVINEIYTDMKSDNVMNRLLQGDVGSGKTIVSVFAMLVAAENGYQSALMCPTEILAEQHFGSISAIIEGYNKVSGKNIRTALLVGGQKKKYRESLRQEIRLGKAQIVIGTHALIQESVEFSSLGFVVIDEQHKFGVMQRARLKEKGLNPDVLVMTATPIPRTLSLTYYGDLDVSVIDEMPSDRKPVKTALRTDEDKMNIYSFVKERLDEGRQAFIIYPIIEESEKLDLKSAEENYRILKDTVFRDYNVGMVHGRMFWYEIEETMNAFKDRKISVLVATTVIEVGIDIPNATVMIIEEAQRFGLSQLHQLRGRVGRGAEQSYCILIGKNLDEESSKRLTTLCSTNDGFKIAETDMEIRGPGEFFGIRQSGVLNLSVTDLTRDRDILSLARKLAFEIIENDPQLRHPDYAMVQKILLTKYRDALYLMNIA